MAANNVRAKRAAAGIPGHAVCAITGISRARLSDIELDHVVATPDDLARIDAAIDGILETRRQLARLAADAGLSLTGVRL